MVGSSPLTRGKHAGGLCVLIERRLIPAHAGKTSSVTISGRAAKAHPRSRGENIVSLSHSRSHAGSSPLTRGKHAGRHADDPRQRLIPAHAGKTRGRLARQGRGQAHPRSRGENSIRPVRICTPAGSSPLTRGKLLWRDHCRVLHRLIPAHAGKTDPARRRRGPRTAHPRSRGENSRRAS